MAEGCARSVAASSSGAHVAATLLAKNDDWWKAVDSRPDAHGIRVYGPPRNWCDAALFLSGVFGPLSAAVTAPPTTQRAGAATRAGVAGLIAFFLGDEGGRALPSPVAAAQTGEMSRRTVVLGGVYPCNCYSEMHARVLRTIGSASGI